MQHRSVIPDSTSVSVALADPDLDTNHGPNMRVSTSAFGERNLRTPETINDACP